MNAFSSNDLVEEEYMPMPIEIAIDENLQILPNRYQLSPNSDSIFKIINNPKHYKKLKDRYVHIGSNDYLIKTKLGDGKEGVTYLAEFDHHKKVVIKAIIDAHGAQETFRNEVKLLSRLSRLYDQDPTHLLIVEEMIDGPSFDEMFDDYVDKHGGTSDYPSNIMPKDSKAKFFQILYDFRNSTNFAHNDFRPYNIINGTVIDFGRSVELSSDPLTRQSQIKSDDEAAQEEWDYFIGRRDLKAIEKNPFLPNARQRAEKVWKLYFERYPENKKNGKYKGDWMEVFEYILATNDTTVDFPERSDYE